MTTTADRWSQISSLFDELVELDPAQRAQRLSALGATDSALAAEVRALLAADASANTMLDNDAAAALPAMLADLDAAPGDGTIGSYRLLRSIGQGGMGEVWLGERTDGAYEQQVAIKLLKRGMDSAAILRRFLQERRILARLNHRHIVRLVDGGMSTDDRPFYVMDYVDGEPITRYASAHALAVRERVVLLAEVADAVAYAHTQLIVHRDLKPSNVLVDESGEPRVLDFGIAKLIEETDDQTLTSTGMRVLSPAYAAPEQILGEAIGTATDVYALGLMLCELLIGQLPQQRRGVSPAQLAIDVTNETIERASTLAGRVSDKRIAELYGDDGDTRQLARTLSGDLDLIIATALQREPARRYATAAAFADDLRRWLEGRPIAARPDSTSYRFTRFVRRHRVGVAAAGLIALSLIGGLGAALWQADKARQQAELALQQAQRAERVKSFLVDIFKQNDPTVSKGEDLNAAQILLHGRDALETSLIEDPETRGELLITIAEIQGNLGQPTDALETAEKAFPLLTGTVSDNDSRLAHAYFVRASLEDYLNRDEEAERDFRAALAIFAIRPEQNADDLDRVESSLAMVLSTTQGAATAVTLQRKVVERLRVRKGDSNVSLANHRIDLALLLEENGDFEQARSEYERVLPHLVNVSGNISPKVCEAERNYAGLLDRLGHSVEALPRFERAMACTEKLYGIDSVPYARTLFSRGILLISLRHYAEAESDFRAAISIYRDSGNDAAHAHRYLGRALEEQGHYDAAAPEYAEAERLYRSADRPHDFQRWRARADYGYAIFRTGALADGRAAIDAALAGLREQIPSGDTPEFMRPLRALGEIARVQGDLATAMQAHRRWHELALKAYGPESRDAHQSAYQLSVDLTAKGDRASLLEAQSLIAKALVRGQADAEPMLPDYVRLQNTIVAAIEKLPMR